MRPSLSIDEPSALAAGPICEEPDEPGRCALTGSGTQPKHIAPNATPAPASALWGEWDKYYASRRSRNPQSGVVDSTVNVLLNQQLGRVNQPGGNSK